MTLFLEMRSINFLFFNNIVILFYLGTLLINRDYHGVSSVNILRTIVSWLGIHDDEDITGSDP